MNYFDICKECPFYHDCLENKIVLNGCLDDLEEIVETELNIDNNN